MTNNNTLKERVEEAISQIADDSEVINGHLWYANPEYIQTALVNSHIETLEQEIERLKKRIWDNSTRKYDGNNLESACKFHSIGAIDWVEILRYEDGQNQVLDDIISHLQQQLSEWRLMK